MLTFVNCSQKVSVHLQIVKNLNYYVKIEWMHEKGRCLVLILTVLSLLYDVDWQSYGSSSG